MHYNQNSSFQRIANVEVTLFTVRMFRVRKRHREWIIENCLGFLKTDFVLSEIRLSLFFVPLKCQTHRVPFYRFLGSKLLRLLIAGMGLPVTQQPPHRSRRAALRLCSGQVFPAPGSLEILASAIQPRSVEDVPSFDSWPRIDEHLPTHKLIKNNAPSQLYPATTITQPPAAGQPFPPHWRRLYPGCRAYPRARRARGPLYSRAACTRPGCARSVRSVSGLGRVGLFCFPWVVVVLLNGWRLSSRAGVG